jgi:hypothetical protein
MKKKPLLESIRESACARPGGVLPWHKRLSASDRKELESVRAAWLRGEINTPKTTLARQLSAELALRGICNIGRDRVSLWLAKKD